MTTEHDAAGNNGARAFGGRAPAALLLSSTLLLSMIGAWAGATFGTRSCNAPPQVAMRAADAGTDDDLPIASHPLEPIVTDVRDAQGAVRHVRVVLQIELRVVISEDDMKKLIPRAREAAVEYLRAQPYETLVSQRAGEIKRELSDQVAKAIGKQRVGRVLLSDFTVQ